MSRCLTKFFGMEASLIERAVRLAVSAHAGQKRKEADIPYIVHPVMVALLLTRHGFSETIIAAALTHDVLEDSTLSPTVFIEHLGMDVFEIVNALTDDHDLPWEEKKLKYIEHVRMGAEGVKAVAVADKIHNAQSLILAHKKQGASVWQYFNRGREKKIWFEEALLKALKETWSHPLVEEYETLLGHMRLLN